MKELEMERNHRCGHILHSQGQSCHIYRRKLGVSKTSTYNGQPLRSAVLILLLKINSALAKKMCLKESTLDLPSAVSKCTV